MKVIIIAEAGVNHNGKLSLAKKLALQAKMSWSGLCKISNF
jgi:sialic acid synthase SpsE